MKIIINNNQAGKDIKSLLKSIGMSLSLVKQLKKIPLGITVNGEHQNVTYVLKENDVLILKDEDTEEETNKYLEPVDIPIEIIFEDENLTVVNKPANMPTHESINNRGNSLANALAYRYRDIPYVFRATNRLDKDTSGVVITANNRYYSGILSKKIKNGEVEKEYIALVHGKITCDGIIEAPIERVGESIIKREVRDDGEYALTEYFVLSSNEKMSLVLVKPKTGRTHQIRVHMSYIGHPILGDTLYGGTNEQIKRQALHCMRMTIDGIGSFFAPIAGDIYKVIRGNFNEEVLPKD
jgi:23S rRNA pseudouridine1911/1915/1917 synthase